MKYLSVIVLIVFSIGFMIDVDALQCYHCIHFEGYNESESSCQNNPISALVSHCVNPHVGPNKIEICVTVTGVVEGRPVVGRGCANAFPEMDGRCVDYANGLIPRIERNATNVNVCFCSKDNCNGSNAASDHQLTYIPLFVVAVYLCHKLVTIK